MGQLHNIDATSIGALLFNEGQLICSELKEFYRKTEASPLSIKLVVTGTENYCVENTHYRLKKDQFLIVNKNSPIETSVFSDKQVRGVCIYPPKGLVEDVMRNQLINENTLLDNPFDTESVAFTEKIYGTTENRTGSFLTQQLPFILHQHQQGLAQPMDEFYLALAKEMSLDQLQINGQLKQLDTRKKHTAEELFRRVSYAKEWIRSHYKENISLDQLAQQAYLSKYHFIRSFKKIYGMSPYQFLMHCRIEKAIALYRKEYSYKEIMVESGFSDVKNLKKALKKQL